jgi:hypothetical protein
MMTDDTAIAKLAELEARIAEMSEEQQEALRPMLEETRKRHGLIKQCGSAARNALADWRIIMKYKIFDLEARLREAAS